MVLLTLEMKVKVMVFGSLEMDGLILMEMEFQIYVIQMILIVFQIPTSPLMKIIMTMYGLPKMVYMMPENPFLIMDKTDYLTPVTLVKVMG